mmetsp:Transcript_20387/g.40089  ORF Transcript_20387/g.40089 Transcript_20387/m.40089 type:complete len:392 (+) Transcript_20387:46-1221(+)
MQATRIASRAGTLTYKSNLVCAAQQQNHWVRTASKFVARRSAGTMAARLADNVPDKMTAVLLDKPVENAEDLGKFVRDDIDVPGKSKPLGPREVLVRNKYCGVNFIDTYFRSGLYPKPLPTGLGQEGAGEVVGKGEEVTDDMCRIGDTVVYMGHPTYAEYAAANINTVSAVPEDVPLEDLLTLSIQGLTAHYLAMDTYPLGKGKTCLIHAAAGGTGQLLVQIAKLLGAETVIGTCSKAKVDIAKNAGCDLVLPYDELDHEEMIKRVKEATGGEGVHVVYDGVGKSTYQMSMKCIRSRGMLVIFGNSSGATPPIDPLDLTSNGCIFLTRPSLYGYIKTHEDYQRGMSDLVNWYKEGKLKVNVQKVFPFKEAGQAHKFIESGKTTGKLLLAFD